MKMILVAAAVLALVSVSGHANSLHDTVKQCVNQRWSLGPFPTPITVPHFCSCMANLMDSAGAKGTVAGWRVGREDKAEYCFKNPTMQ
jgi:hypothetical protein